MELLEDKGREYRRFRFTPRERAFLSLNGFQPVLSSNVAGVGIRENGIIIGNEIGTDLLIRFHNGSVYAYRNRGSDYDNILKSNSKGQWVWRNLRRRNVPYEKLGAIPLPDDIGVTDEQIFQEIDNRYLSDLTQFVDVPVFQSFAFLQGIQLNKIIIGGITVFQPIPNPFNT
jgi:hypothetical protein